MNYRLNAKTLGKVLLIEAISMIPSLLVTFLYGENPNPLLFSILALFVPALALSLLRPRSNRFTVRDGFIIVAVIWIVMSLFGALPYFFSGYIPSYIDCFFESVSGFTTTGASILTNIEALPKGILFWRSSTNWIGGMGILVLTLALFKSLGDGAHHLMRAESPGPSPDKLVSRLGKSSKILYGFYIILTVAEIISLLICGLDLFNATTTTMATAGTGGFSVLNQGIGGYGNPAAEVVIAVFMALFGVNFSIYYLLAHRKFRLVWKNSELRLYLGILLIGVAAITINTLPLYSSLGDGLRSSFFQASSILTTTGFSTANFDLWPMFSKTILFLFMFIGGCAGSTSGGIKCTRIYILFQSFRRECRKILHPNSVSSIKVDERTVLSDNTVWNITQFFFSYMVVAFGGFIFVALDNFDFSTTVSSVAACIGNIGPGFGEAGPVGNYAAFSGFSKFILSACMLIGRLEIFPILLLFSPKTWKSNG